MKYLDKSFSVPACTKRMTDEEYEIAVGVRPAPNPPAPRKKGKEQ